MATAADIAELRTAAAALGDPVAGVGGTARPGRVAFVFPGQGAQWAGMGRELLAESEVFAGRMAECAAALDPLTGWSLLAAVADDACAATVDVVQPLSFAVMVSLAAVWESFGVRPDVVVGHSQGEIAAACVAGALTLPDAALIVVARSRVIAAGLAGRGAMVSVELPEPEARGLAERFGAAVSIAALNGPESTVLAGAVPELEAVLAECAARGIRSRRVEVDYASHSAQVDAVAAELRQALAGIAPVPGRVPMHSTVRAAPVTGPELDAEYWIENLRRPVRLLPVLRTLLAERYRFFLEVSSHPVLTPAVERTAEVAAADAVAVGTLRRGSGGLRRVLESVGQGWAHGLAVDWGPAFGAGPRAAVPLPTYAFQRKRYWLDAAAPRGTGAEPGGSAFWRAVDDGDADAIAADWETDAALVRPLLPGLTGWRQRQRAAATAEAWRFREEWRRLELPAGRPAGNWLLAGLQNAHTEIVGAALAAAGGTVVPVELAGLDRAGMAARLRECGVAPDSLAGVVSTLAIDDRIDPERPELSAGVAATIALTQALGDAGIGARLWCVTSGAVGAATTSPWQTQVWGLGRVAALEYPGRWGGLVDLPAAPDARVAERLAALLAAGTDEDQVTVRPDGVYGRRLVPDPGAAAAAPWRPTGTVLVTGGTGALGGQVARWAAANGAAHLLLVSRAGGAAAGAGELAAELRAAGAAVTISACDVTDRGALAAVLGAVPAEFPLTAVVHTAGVAGFEPFDDCTPATVAASNAAKVLGAVHLDALTAGLPLAAFVLFSSGAAAWGSAGNAAYAAGNAHLDGLAVLRAARGLPATSIAWGAWAGGGMTQRGSRDMLLRRGVGEMDPAVAVRALAAAVGHGDTTVTIADMDWARFAETFTIARPSPLIAELPAVRALGAAAPRPETTAALARELGGMTATEQGRYLTAVVRAEAAAVLGHEGPEALDTAVAFSEQGFDSLTAIELRNRLTGRTGLVLPSTLVFDYPTVADVGAFLRDAALGGAGAAAPAARSSAEEPVAIVAMACRFPGGVESAEELWALLSAGTDAISAAPDDRGWDAGDGGATRDGGFVRGVTDFDAGLFGISPREATAMDPQQRVLLEAAWELFERAGIDPRSVRGSDTGVFVGGTPQDHAVKAVFGGAATEGYLLTGSSASALSGRISYELGLEGPAITVDTACSSSLVALHLAAKAVRGGECSLALAGGVAVMSTPSAFSEFARTGGLSVGARCRAFAASANGIGWGEGVGLVLVERLSEARRRGHRVLAVIRSSALNQDGASNGFSAPNGPSQQRVIRQALADAGLTPADVDAVEAHGTGTVLGDPIEAQALLATYGADRPADRPLWLGSIKSNIGHTMAAAGIAGVIKMVEALRRGVLPRTLHVDEPTPEVDWSAGAVALLTAEQPWPEVDRRRRAGISSFGISGTNAHLILEQAPDDPAAVPVAQPEDTARAWLLAARTPAGLRAQAGRLREFLAASPTAALGDIAAELATARAELECRGAVVAAGRDEFLAGLAALAAGTDGAGVVEGSAADRSVVFVFPGQGGQRSAEAGRELLATCPAFAERLRECAAVLDPATGWSLLDAISGAAAVPMDRADVSQPLHFAVLVALAAGWESFGVRPDAVVGHSLGEVAAACVAGALTLADAARVVVARSRVSSNGLAGRGWSMALLGVSAERAAELAAPCGGAVSVAAINSPTSTVLAGPDEQLRLVTAECERSGVRVRPLDFGYGSHSAQVDGVTTELGELLVGLRPRRGRVPIWSTVHGEPLAGPELDAAYWVANLRRPVRFQPAVLGIAAAGHRMFIEVSPHPVLLPAIEETLDASGDDAVVLDTIRRGDGGEQRLRRSVAQAWALGAHVDRVLLAGGPAGARIDLPPYAFQRKRYWLEPEGSGAPATPPAADPVDAEFWQLVETGDLASLAELVEAEPGADAGEIVTALSRWRHRARRKALGDSWRHVEQWRLFEPAPAAAAGRPLVVRWDVPDPAGAASELLAALAERNPVVVSVAPGADRAALAARIGAALAGCGPVSAVLSLLAFTAAADRDHPDVAAAVSANLALIQALADLDVAAPRWVLTRGAVTVGAGDAEPVEAQAQLWGLARVAALEQPRSWGGVLDLPEVVDAEAAAVAADVLAGGHGEDQVAVRGQRAVGRRLAPLAPDGPGWTPRGTVLITGGTGALGGHVARWAAAAGAGHLLLLSRSGERAESAQALVAELRETGAAVTLRACDVTNAAELAGALAAIPPEFPLRAVVHTAGIGGYGLLADTTVEQIATVNAAKVAGARHLDLLTRDAELDAFVLFSSGAAAWGSAGNACYALGNAYLDGLALRRRAAGRPATSIAWGMWGGGGMAEGAAEERLAPRGLRHMPPEVAAATVGAAVGAGDTVVTIADIDWPRFAQTFTITRPSPLISEIPGVRRTEADAEPEDGQRNDEWRTRLAELDGPERGELLRATVRELVAAVLGHDRDEVIDQDRPFLELGFDSLTAIELRNRLRRTTGLDLPASVVFDHPSTALLAEHLESVLAGVGAPGPAAPTIGIATLYRDACAAKRYVEANEMAMAAARLRPTFDSPDASTMTREPLRLAAGPEPVVLIGIPATSPLSGPHEFSRMAKDFRGVRDLWVLPLPGFLPGELLPAGWDFLIGILADAVLRVADGRRFALMGRSSGGSIAHAVQGELEKRGFPAEALVLLDSFEIGSAESVRVQSGVLYQLQVQESKVGRMDDVRLTAMAGYYRLLAEWERREVSCPTLFVAASEADAESGAEAVWTLRHDLVRVPGDHFSMTEEYSTETAKAVEEWVRRVTAATPE
ncbi:type I polyketide synthase [Nocardia sp. NPDC057353]|uniref:type I polyketide synthase n=1 Tax=Nocardia sp. NPDC057353 TaxID=3346104 RepID=UPI0036269284